MGIRATFQDAGGEGFVTRKPMDEEMDLDITPMIDVTFLLLIFFMVTSTMQAEKDHQIPQAKYGEKIDTDKVTIVMLEYSGSTTLPPKIVFPDKSEGTLDQLTQLVKDELDKNKAHVIVRADGRIPNGYITNVFKAIAKVEGVTFSVGVREKR